MEHQSNSIEAEQPTPATDLMGYEGQVQIPEETTLPETSNAEDVQTIINKAVKEVTVDEETGKYIYPKDMDPMLKAAVAATKSYRDNQSGFTKSQQALKESEAEAQALRNKLAEVNKGRLELTQEEKATLDGLKTTDPEKWRQELNRIESEAKQSIQSELDSVTEEVRQKASGEYELQRRYDYLEEFNEGRKTPITTETLDNEVPPRITNKLAKNEITFEEYLDEVSQYLDKGKVVSKEKPPKSTDLNSVSGTTEASPSNENEEIDYESVTF